MRPRLPAGLLGALAALLRVGRDPFGPDANHVTATVPRRRKQPSLEPVYRPGYHGRNVAGRKNTPRTRAWWGKLKDAATKFDVARADATIARRERRAERQLELARIEPRPPFWEWQTRFLQPRGYVRRMVSYEEPVLLVGNRRLPRDLVVVE